MILNKSHKLYDAVKYHNNNRRGSSHALTAAVALLSLSGGVPALADEHFALEEVIVTAQKRAESLQDVPISISAVSGEKIQDAGIPDMQALSGHVPGLQIGQGPLGDNIFIRGVGSGNNRAFEQSVGMYIDGISMGRSHQYRSPFLDLERVEVLRGPQGVLFGKNTVAGVVNVTTASTAAGDAFSGSVTAEYEPSQNTKNLVAVVGGSLTESLGARLAVKNRSSDGWVENKFTNKDEAQIDEQTARLSLNWTPSDDVDVLLKLSTTEMDTKGDTGVIVNASPAASLADMAAVGRTLDALAFGILSATHPQATELEGKDFVNYKNNNSTFGREPETDLTADNVSIKVDWELGEYTLTSVTGYSAYEYLDRLECDFGPLTFIGCEADFDFDQVSQEIRLASPVGNKFEWIVGAYFEEQDLAIPGAASVDGTLGAPAIVDGATGNNGFTSLWQALGAGLGYPAEVIGRFSDYQQDSETLSVFLQGSWEITDSLKATLGVRYAEDEKSMAKKIVFVDDITGFEESAADPDNYAHQLGLDAMWGGVGFNRDDYKRDRTEYHMTPAFNLQWDVNEDLLVYLNYSEGYKGGGFSATDGIESFDLDGDGVYETPSEDFEFEDEEVKTIELGGKFVLLDGSMRLNWALFQSQYKNLQVTSYTGRGFTVGNAAESTIEGVEMEVEWQASEAVHMGANIAYLDYEYDKYDTAPCTVAAQVAFGLAGFDPSDCTQDLSGSAGAFAPELSASIYGDYTKPMGDNLVLKLGADANFKDEYYADGALDPNTLVDATWKLNVRASLRDTADTWEVALYGNNITDEQTLTGTIQAPALGGYIMGYADAAAVWGIRGRYSF